ncbi:hypothetical protein PsorP6_001187 [Peronosclerospora sorghi]|uniref:Uncharacterized protein n=1 Tax=Peronosclerospora sorghi TaxID=230839 RepID=A0ACC0WTJ6_9STRA|nr:hypothetical protein PsorP6_001187 [Peronosclerospora sorghi]
MWHSAVNYSAQLEPVNSNLFLRDTKFNRMVAPGAKKPSISRLDASDQAALRARYEALGQVEETFRDFDIVWAKIHGFPWWPGVMFHSWDVVRRAGIQTDPKIVAELVVPPPEKVVELDAVTGQETANFRLKRHCLIMFLDKFNFSLVEIDPSNVASFTTHYHLYEYAVLGSKSGRWSKKKAEFRRALAKATDLLHMGNNYEEQDLVMVEEPTAVGIKQRIEKAADCKKEEQRTLFNDKCHGDFQLIEDPMSTIQEGENGEKKVTSKVPKKPLVQEKQVVEVKDEEDDDKSSVLTSEKSRRKAPVKVTRSEASNAFDVTIISRSPSPVNVTKSPEKKPHAWEMEKAGYSHSINEKKEIIETDMNELKNSESEGGTSPGMKDTVDTLKQLPRQNEDQSLEQVAAISEKLEVQNVLPTPLSSIWTTGMSSSDSTKQSQLAYTQDFVWNDAIFTDEHSVAEEKQLASAQQQLVDYGIGRERKRQPRSVQQAQIRQNLMAGNLDPHTMVQCAAYRSKEYVEDPTNRSRGNPTVDPPFEVVVHPDAAFVADLHAHLATCEIIGFLGGKWDEASKILYIQAAFPCRSLVIDGDDGSTDVEMDPGSEIELRSIIENAQLEVVGWYHSHPAFAPDPSVRDIENQTSYQQLFQRPSAQDPSGKKEDNKPSEPFVGLIVGTYDTRRNTPVSLFRFFHTSNEAGNGGTRRKISMPYELIPRRRHFRSVLEDEERIRMQSCSMYHSVLQYFKLQLADTPPQLPVDVKTLGQKAMYRSSPTRVRASVPPSKRKLNADDTGANAVKKTRQRGRPHGRSSSTRNRPVSIGQHESKEQTVDSAAEDTKTVALAASSGCSIVQLKTESQESTEIQDAKILADVVERMEATKGSTSVYKKSRESANPKQINECGIRLSGAETNHLANENAVVFPSPAPTNSQQVMLVSPTPVDAPMDVDTSITTFISPSSLISLSSGVMSMSRSRKRTRKPTTTTKMNCWSASSSSERPSSDMSTTQNAVQPSGPHPANGSAVKEEVTLLSTNSDGPRTDKLIVKQNGDKSMDVTGTQDKDRIDEENVNCVSDVMMKMVDHVVASISDGINDDTKESSPSRIKTSANDRNVGIAHMKDGSYVHANESAIIPLFGSNGECEDIQTSLQKLASYTKLWQSVVADSKSPEESTPKTKLKLTRRKTKLLQEDDKQEHDLLLSLRTKYGAGVSGCVEQVISLIDYYRDFERRTDLNEIWKARVTKLEKIQISLLEYVQYLNISVALRRDFIEVRRYMSFSACTMSLPGYICAF